MLSPIEQAYEDAYAYDTALRAAEVQDIFDVLQALDDIGGYLARIEYAPDGTPEVCQYTTEELWDAAEQVLNHLETMARDEQDQYRAATDHWGQP